MLNQLVKAEYVSKQQYSSKEQQRITDPNELIQKRVFSFQSEKKLRLREDIYPVPTGPPMPTVNALSVKSLLTSGGALLLKKPGEYMGS